MTCRHCGQPIKRCDDTYEGHHCNGWVHSIEPGGGAWFHSCDPSDVPPPRRHAEPAPQAVTP